MAIDILSSISSTFSGQTLRQLSGLIGESEDATRAGLRSAGPAMLAGLMRKGSDTSGAASLFRTITSDAVDSGIAGKLSGLLGNRSGLDSIVQGGGTLLGSLFGGNRADGVSKAIAQVAGLKPSSAATLLSLGAPLLLGFLKKQVTQGGLDVGGLTSMLFGQRQALQKVGLDNRITSAMGFDNLNGLLEGVPEAAADRVTEAATYVKTGTTTRTAPPPPPPPQRARERSWLPVAAGLALGALALGLLFNWLGRDRDVVRTAAIESEIQVASLPARVYFDPGQASVDAADRRALAAIASSAQASGTPVVVTGFTDRSENAGQDLTIANDRAMAVREALLAEGMPPASIVIRPPEIATAGPEAEARRVEIAAAR